MEHEDRLDQLKAELQIARLNTPSDDALQKYYQLSAHIKQSDDSSLWRAIKATLTWDSRDRFAAQGARGFAQSDNYRLLYEAEQTEIEIMIESQAQHHYIEGDIVRTEPSDAADTTYSLALITLVPEESAGHSHYEVESDEHGRFRIAKIAKGSYNMQLLMFDGNLIELPTLQLQ